MHPSEKVALMAQLNEVNAYLDECLDALKEQATLHNMSPFKMLTTDGKMLMVPILLAKAETLSAIVKLKTP